jgi:hypothetical protein
MDSSVALLAFASFLGGLLVTSRVIAWIAGLLLFLKPSTPTDTGARFGLAIAPLFLHSGPWLLAIAVTGVYYAATSPRAAYLWAVVGGLTFTIAFIVVATPRVFLQQRKPRPEPPPLTPERFLALRRRFFWRNSLFFAFCMPAVFAFPSSLDFGRDISFLVVVFVAGFACGWAWSWFMWQWYGEALKVNEKKRQRRQRENAA